VEGYVQTGAPLPVAVEKVDESLGLAWAVDGPEMVTAQPVNENDQALLELESMMRAVKPK
jgi:hypothetical protein